MDVLPGELRDALRGVAATARLLACWDFDGTLAPIVSDPQAARPLPGALPLLQELAGLSATEVALLSGRARVDLARLSGASDPLVLVGSHGAELPDDVPAVGGATAEAPGTANGDRLAEVIAAVTGITDGIDGVLLETKPVSVAVHVRNVADRDRARAASEEILAGPGSWPGVHVTTGKEVVELSVRRVDKGAAISALRARFAATAVIFVGDDVTDERGFAVLQAADVGIKVGAGETAAGYRVDSPGDVLQVLQVLVSDRASSTGLEVR